MIVLPLAFIVTVGSPASCVSVAVTYVMSGFNPTKMTLRSSRAFSAFGGSVTGSSGFCSVCGSTDSVVSVAGSSLVSGSGVASTDSVDSVAGSSLVSGSGVASTDSVVSVAGSSLVSGSGVASKDSVVSVAGSSFVYC